MAAVKIAEKTVKAFHVLSARYIAAAKQTHTDRFGSGKLAFGIAIAFNELYVGMGHNNSPFNNKFLGNASSLTVILNNQPPLIKSQQDFSSISILYNKFFICQVKIITKFVIF